MDHINYYRRRQDLEKVNCCHVAETLPTVKFYMFYVLENKKVKLMQS